MLNQFYSYLAERIITFFENNPLTPGAKFNIQFENEEEVRELYNALQENSYKDNFDYRDENGIIQYKSYLLRFPNGMELIVSSTMNNVQPDFLTRLRNLVGVEEGYENRGILFIHNTELDSIMGGTESMMKEGMPFHIDSIQNDILDILNKKDSGFSELEKVIIDNDLQRKKEYLSHEAVSVFEYKEILDITSKGKIDKDEYKNFGLFYDSKLEELEGKDLKNRLKENIKLFTKVDEIHNYGDPEADLEKYFDTKGVGKLKKEDWRDVDFKEVKKSADEKKNTKPIEYLGCSEEWDIEEGSTKVKSRIRNVIIFNENGIEDIKVEFKFDEHVKKANAKKKDKNIEIETTGKKLIIKMKDTDGKPDFYKVTYKDDKGIKFDFKILILRCKAKYLENIKSKFSLVIGKKNYISIKTNESNIVFNEFGKRDLDYMLENNNEYVEINEEDKLRLKISENFKYEDDNELIMFNLILDEETVPFGIIGTSEKPGPIEGIKVWQRKLEKKSNFKLITETKLIHGTKEYFVRDEFRRSLTLEKQIIEEEGIYFEETNNGLEAINIKVSDELRNAYNKIIEFYKIENNIPSLYYLDEKIKELYREYLEIFLMELNSIKDGDYIQEKERNLFKIGTIKRVIEDRELLFTPLHPLNVAYQLSIVDELKEEKIEYEVIKKFNATYLLPYISLEDRLYIPMEQNHSPEWKVYVDEKLPRYKSSRDFVSKLVNEKIKEFVEHFKYMFDIGKSAPIKINLYNTGDSKEILQGVFKYYVNKLKNSEVSNIIPMDIYIYSNKEITNAFEEVAFNDDIKSLKEAYGLDLKVDNMTEEDVLDIYRDKVNFYSKDLDSKMEYAHITFIEMNNEAKIKKANMSDIPTGVIMNGKISGVPSVFLGDSYRTGFGTKFANTESELMKIAIKLNSLNAALTGDPYNSDQCIAISVPNSSKEKLDMIYNSSHWVTFINPKVDLNFFKNDPDAKDLLIIHYSDQYTTAGGYDAITVTRRSEPYKRVIEEFLEKYEIENVEKYSSKVINMFNAINGDWLLRLLSSKSYAPKEKISILSAIKLALAKFKNENIIWIPISLEELLRVSGGAGLKQKEGIFTAKNLNIEGATSDDILMVGIDESGENTAIYYYPIEVKIGENKNSYIEKGKEQVEKTKNVFKENLLPDKEGNISALTSLYRNFLMQLVVTSAEKLTLYEVSNSENWDKVINTDLRRKLLNEEYYISTGIEKSIGEAAVLSFKNDCPKETFKVEDGIGFIELDSKNGIDFITKEISQIKEIIEIEEIFKDKEEFRENTIEVNLNKDHIENVKEDDKKTVEIINEVIFESELKSNEPEHIIEENDIQEDRNIEIVFGNNEKSNREVIWYPNDTNKIMHTNTGIIGTMGTGKTQFTKSVITQLYRESKYNVDSKELGILIFDYKGDYNKNKKDFIDATNAKVFELYKLPFNPLSITQGENSKNMLPLHIASSLRETLTKAFNLGPKQSNLLKNVIMEAYEKRGINKGDKSTWNKPAPTLKDVYDIYIDREDFKEDSLYAAFSELIDFEIFEPDPFETQSLFELINGVTVIDLSGYDEGIQNLVVAITLDLFYAQMQAVGHSKIEGHLRQLNKIILVDEADNFLSKDFPALRKILKEGREFGVGTILSTQLLSHFSTGENEYANYILSWIIHRVDDLNLKEVKKIFNTQNKADEELLFNKIKSLKKHHSIVKMGDSDRPVYMRDRAFWELNK